MQYVHMEAPPALCNVTGSFLTIVRSKNDFEAILLGVHGKIRSFVCIRVIDNVCARPGITVTGAQELDEYLKPQLF